MVKIVVNGKLVEISEDELEAKFAPRGRAVDEMRILRSLSAKPKQQQAIMEDLGLKEEDEHNRNYSKVRYHMVKLNEAGLVGRHKINAKTVIWFLTEKGLQTLHATEKVK